MAKVKRNPILKGLSGKLGDVVLRQTRSGKTIIRKKPDFSNRQFSQGQLDHQARVKLAAAYGVANKENPIYVQKAEGTDKNPYNIAFQDWFHPPVVHGIQYADGRVRVDVTDDAMVSQVTITILDPEGNVLEQNEAERVNGVTWEYRPVNKGRIRVEAWDLAGNVTRQEFPQPLGDLLPWEQSTRMA